MSLFFNDSGLITRGFGKDQRIITRGMSIRIDLRGIGPYGKRKKEYSLDIFALVKKKINYEINIFVPIEIKKNKKLKIITGIIKSSKKEIRLWSKVNCKKLFEVIDNI